MTIPYLSLLLRAGGVLLLFRMLGLPLARLALGSLPETAYAVSGILALVLAGHVTWLLAHFGMELGWLSIAIGIGVVALGAALAARRLRAAGHTLWPGRDRLVRHHGVFAAALLLGLAITARNPDVDPDSERFMDYAMVNAVTASRQLPLEDPWFAGEIVSYYDYGYYTVAYLSLLVGPLEHVFLLAIALTYAGLAAGVTALGRDLGGRVAGWAAGWLVVVSGNLDGLVQTLQQAGRFVRDTASGWPGSIDWFQAARAITGCITEFPFFSLLWGDLHPYVLALPLWPVVLGLAVQLSRTGGAIGASAEGWATTVCVATVYAALLATHTWDAVPAAAVLLGLAWIGDLRQSGGDPSGHGFVPARLGRAGMGLALGCSLAVPYLQRAPVAGRGLDWVTTPSPLLELASAWGVQGVVLGAGLMLGLARHRHRLLPLVGLGAGLLVALSPSPGIGLSLLVALASCWMALAGAPAQVTGWVLAAIGAGLVFGVEVLYVDDFYGGELERMNTVFKAYVVAWLLLGLAAALTVPWLLRQARRCGRWPGRLTTVALVVLAIAGGLYPLRATRARSGDLLSPVGFDVRRSFQNLYPDDAAACETLRRLPRGVILEATDGPYSWHGRFSTFTGFPTVLGWGHHEAGWRNQWDGVAARKEDVEAAYRASSASDLQAILERYDVRYVVVGSLERERYGAAVLAELDLPLIVRHGKTTIYGATREAR